MEWRKALELKIKAFKHKYRSFKTYFSKYCSFELVPKNMNLGKMVQNKTTGATIAASLALENQTLIKNENVTSVIQNRKKNMKTRFYIETPSMHALWELIAMYLPICVCVNISAYQKPCFCLLPNIFGNFCLCRQSLPCNVCDCL